MTKKKKEQKSYVKILDKIVADKDNIGTSGIAGITITGKDSESREVNS